MSNNSELPERISALEKRVAELTERLDNLSANRTAPAIHHAGGVSLEVTFKKMLKKAMASSRCDRAMSAAYGFRGQ